ncbi:hypothetical protein QO004_002489 [Rhizobium mesoamericanum]|nr:hypothetical protein [Rhizobium mesoamericanum]
MPQQLKALTALLWVAGYLTVAAHSALGQEAQRVRGAAESLLAIKGTGERSHPWDLKSNSTMTTQPWRRR